MKQYYIKGIMHTLDKNTFEVFEEKSFHNGITNLNDYHYEIGKDDDTNLEFLLREFSLEEDNLKEDTFYLCLASFNISYTQDYFGEHDFDIEDLDFKFNELNQEDISYIKM